MSDIFHEVDEEVRREQLKRLWDRYGNLLIALAIIVVASVAAWRGYDWYQSKRAAEAGAAFDAAARLAEQGKPAEAQAAFARIAADGTAGYRVLARLREAEQVASTDQARAVSLYDAIATDPSAGPVIQDLASVRAALLLVDSAPQAELDRRMEPLAQPGGSFRHSAREILALAAWRAGDMAAARRWCEAVINDPEAPAGIRSRIDVLMSLLGESAKS